MRETKGSVDIGKLGQAARSERGDPALTPEEAVALIRRHIVMETLRTSDYDDDLWALWVAETARTGDDATNADVLDGVLARVREGD